MGTCVFWVWFGTNRGDDDDDDDDDDEVYRQSWRELMKESRQEDAAWWSANGQQWAKEQGVDEADVADYMPPYDNEDDSEILE